MDCIILGWGFFSKKKGGGWKRKLKPLSICLKEYLVRFEIKAVTDKF